jgi:putative phosphoesterase
MPGLTVGLISDTHIPHRLDRLPDEVLHALRGVDVILHAGDVDDPAALAPLRAIAPVHAVRGNFHILDLSDGGATLPAMVELTLAGYRIVLTHGHRGGFVGFLLKGLRLVGETLRLVNRDGLNRLTARRLARQYPGAGVIVFGHSHRPCVTWVGQTLVVNPGSVIRTPKDPPTVARLHLGGGKRNVEIVPLPEEGISCKGATGARVSNESQDTHHTNGGDPCPS